MKHPVPEVVWKKLFVKSEIVSIGQQIIDFSRETLDGADNGLEKYDKKLDEERTKRKN